MEHRELYDSHIHPLSPIPTGILPKLDFNNTLKAILFDIYGTLFISESGDISTLKSHTLKDRQLNALMVKYDISDSPDNLVSRLTTTIKQTHAKLIENHIDFPEVNIDRIWMEIHGWNDVQKAQAFSREFELIANPIYPMPNLDKMIRNLSQKHIMLGIISNAQFYTIELFEYFFNKNIFQLGFHPDLVFLSYQHDHAKPSLYLFELAGKSLKKRHVSADNILYVGNDMLNDISTAQSVGFKTALFAGDMRSLRLRKEYDVCKNIHPDVVFTDLSQLIDLI